MIIVAIIRIAAGNIASNQVDAAWAVVYLRVEACFGVMVISVSAFRALYVAHQASKYNTHSPCQKETQNASLGMSSKVKSVWNERFKSSSLDSNTGGSDAWRESSMPATPSPVRIGVSTYTTKPTRRKSSDEDRVILSVRELELPLQGPNILIPRNFESNKRIHSSRSLEGSHSTYQAQGFYQAIEAARKHPSAWSFV